MGAGASSFACRSSSRSSRSAPRYRSGTRSGFDAHGACAPPERTTLHPPSAEERVRASTTNPTGGSRRIDHRRRCGPGSSTVGERCALPRGPHKRHRHQRGRVQRRRERLDRTQEHRQRARRHLRMGGQGQRRRP
ncbi:hypothetical protein ACFPRL_24930 [Pseudoclavibacter helvolus]